MILTLFCGLLRLNPGARGEHLTSQLSWAASCLTISHTCLSLALALNGVSVDAFLDGEYGFTYMVQWRVDTILENVYGIQGQKCVALFQGSEMPAGFHYRSLVLGI